MDALDPVIFTFTRWGLCVRCRREGNTSTDDDHYGWCVECWSKTIHKTFKRITWYPEGKPRRRSKPKPEIKEEPMPELPTTPSDEPEAVVVTPAKSRPADPASDQRPGSIRSSSTINGGACRSVTRKRLCSIRDGVRTRAHRRRIKVGFRTNPENGGIALYIRAISSGES